MTTPGYSSVQQESSSNLLYRADECKVRFQQGDEFHQDIELHQCEEFHLYDEFHQRQGLWWRESFQHLKRTSYLGYLSAQAD